MATEADRWDFISVFAGVSPRCYRGQARSPRAAVLLSGPATLSPADPLARLQVCAGPGARGASRSIAMGTGEPVLHVPGRGKPAENFQIPDREKTLLRVRCGAFLGPGSGCSDSRERGRAGDPEICVRERRTHIPRKDH